ncbi:TPR repeat-containing protein YpiA [Halolactibacillus alkaliphilus]|uniref:TPR repeat-containing protein YpiA n=2 Tax=Halolactibacillus alkaliphilus TaxID=442899 RepID=A0A511X152_9BACI|nr:TPR repeat-containing protein YpiA [Halolactibacillus alkaliphilus]GGN70147.1 TPR repeat-containing protein YpiA [Halolactibacillus alkaliphilus]
MMEEIYHAIQLIEQEQTEEALTVLKEFLPGANDDEQFVISDLYIQLGLLPEAKEILERLYTHYPDETELKLVLSEIYIDLEDDEAALTLLNQIDSHDPHYLESLLTQADLYQTQGLFEVADHKLVTAKQLAPNEILIDFARAELSFSNGEYQRAIPHYLKVKQTKDQMAEVNIDHRLAESYAQIGEFESALEHFTQFEHEDEETLFQYGFVARQAHRNDIAIKAWESLIDLEPEYPSVYMPLADVYEEEGLIKEAYSISKRGLDFLPLNKELLLTVAGLARRNGERENSYQYAREAVAVDVGYKEAVLFLVENYREDGDDEAIIDLLTHILDQGEEDGYYLWELAKACDAVENYSEAYLYYNQAYDEFKDDVDFLKAYGYFLVEEGKHQEAKEVFQRYLSLDVTDYEIENYLERLGDSGEPS